ncbi:C40 family peptidase [Maribacter polysiphoniae]|uniref:C40 family peptidase n=1 Tax=Maribacter polysiphoniae TaxID=429344 RepID=A0A316E6F8_9FLAO|nr:C40 family peptidase [Maribacter polysiphoniae]MBD1262292.1 C40 family peptidase [Maribacter polysiphoniae]PWK25991.1 cell wall-associated NlpC family hydrolase [Maribacter polysiphoniae]
MKRLSPFIVLLLFLSSCVAKKKTTYSKERKITVEASPEITSPEADNKLTKTTENHSSESKVNRIINTALTFSGVRYKYGGTTKKGMDCSGLLYVAFKKNDVALPRVSSAMANQGKRIRVNQVEKGDLLFFKTSRKAKKINHVGLVVAVDNDDIKFIHASTSRGVIVSSLREGYWNYAFVKATRVL